KVSVNDGSLPSLEALCGDLTTATNINRALAQVFLLMAQGRIAQKQAVAFGYLAQLLLQTVPGIRSEFVSAFGYQPWATQLKEGLERQLTIRPGLPAKVTHRMSFRRSTKSSRAPIGSEGPLSDQTTP